MKNIQTLKGFRDFLPQEVRKRNYVLSKLKNVFEMYGFEPLETPVLEYEELLNGKYGDEGDKLMYKFEDLGKRKVAMRYDQTVPLARVMSQYQLPLPFKRYQMQNVWRADNTQKGRYREFLQCDIDTIGSNSLISDAEIIACTLKAYESLGFTSIKILINDKAVFGELSIRAIAIIDKLKKIGQEAVLQELVKTNNAKDLADAKNILDKITRTEPTKIISEIQNVLQTMGIDEKKVIFTPSLARGLDYYTGSIIEVECDEYPYGSLGGGGRYDNLIGMFSGKKIPAVGFAFGFDRTIEAMDSLHLFPLDLEQTTKVLVTIFSSELTSESLKLVTMLRDSGISSEIYQEEASKIEKQVKYANQKSIPYVVIIGPEENDKNVVTLRDMSTGKQESLSVQKLIHALASK